MRPIYTGSLRYEESSGSTTRNYYRGIGRTPSNSTCLVSLMASSQIRSPSSLVSKSGSGEGGLIYQEVVVVMEADG
jgi:hypothetical protein